MCRLRFFAERQGVPPFCEMLLCCDDPTWLAFCIARAWGCVYSLEVLG